MWTIPNLMTMARIALAPIAFLLIASGQPDQRFAAAAIVAFCGLLDRLDGWIARRFDQVTDFGIVWDPVADKILVNGTMLAAAVSGYLPAFFAYLCIVRDLVVSGVRASSGLPASALAADRWGKWKTRLQFVSVLAALIWPGLATRHGGAEAIAFLVLLSGTAFVTFASGFRYVRRYRG